MALLLAAITLGLIGFTVAAPFYSHDRLLGVAAVDITLIGLILIAADAAEREHGKW